MATTILLYIGTGNMKAKLANDCEIYKNKSKKFMIIILFCTSGAGGLVRAELLVDLNGNLYFTPYEVEDILKDR